VRWPTSDDQMAYQTRFPFRVALLVVIGTALFFMTPLPAQAQTTAPSGGLDGFFGSVSAGMSDAKIGSVSDRHTTWGFDFGWRFDLPSKLLSRISVTPKFSMTATHLRGLGESDGPFAYASFGLGLRTTFRVSKVRVFFDALRESQTAELPAANQQSLNYSGPSHLGWGAGVEIPLTKQGRGIQIGVRRETGTFSSVEKQGVETNATLEHRATVMFVGWCGRFTGISLPWR
jgi:hypothetical protein